MNICVAGTGYVGLVSAACFAEMGNHVACVDINPAVVSALEQGILHIFEPGLKELVVRNHAEGRLSFTTSLEKGLEKAVAVFICVGTPSLPDGSCDLGYVFAVADEIGRYMQHPLVIIDKSTVPVGTADKVRATVASALAKRGVNLDFDVVSNPEFLKEGDAVKDFMKPDRVVVGTESSHSAALLRTLYAPFARSRDKLIIMGVRSAEMTKYAANCMLATKISFINEIASICEQVGADVREVRTGIGADQRIGYHFIYPGIGYGGSCFPKDVRALIHTATEAGVAPQLLQSVDAVNLLQKQRMAKRIAAFFEAQGGAKGKTLAVWGLAFKANTDDLREAAALAIIENLAAKGILVQAYDPVAGSKAREHFDGNSAIVIVENQYDALKNADALLVATEWNQFRTPDFVKIKQALSAPVLFDGRNLYDAEFIEGQGFRYFCVGRS